MYECMYVCMYVCMHACVCQVQEIAFSYRIVPFSFVNILVALKRAVF